MLDKIGLSAWRNCQMRILMLFSLALLGGCATSVVVTPDIPKPLVQRLPLNAGIVYTDTFKNYVYLESEKKRGSLKSIDFTVAQMAMFDRVFGGLTNLVEVDDSSRVLSIEPQILDFQYTAPAETKLKQYEIWIKYRLRLRDANNASIADWTIKGYGKTPTGLLTSASSAFNAATNIALRDVGAQLSTRFPKQRVVKTLLDGGSPTPIPEPEEPKSEKTAINQKVNEKVELATNDSKPEDNTEGLNEQPSFAEKSTGDVSNPSGQAGESEAETGAEENDET